MTKNIDLKVGTIYKFILQDKEIIGGVLSVEPLQIVDQLAKVISITSPYKVEIPKLDKHLQKDFELTVNSRLKLMRLID